MKKIEMNKKGMKTIEIGKKHQEKLKRDRNLDNNILTENSYL